MCVTLLTALSLSVLGSTLADKHGVVKVQVDSDAILPCSPSTKENLEFKAFDWIKENDNQRDVFFYRGSGITSTGADKFKGRVSYFPDELKNGNASIIIRNAKMEDSGNYTCVFPRLLPEERFHVELVVEPVPKDRYGKEKGASSKPHIMRVNFTEDRIQLHCLVQGASSKPEVEFQDSAGNVLPAEEPQVLQSGQRYTVILITTVTKTDRFRCVAKQKEIHHETSAETYVSVREKRFEDTCSKVDVTGWFSGGVLFGVLLGVLLLAAFLALLVRTKHIKIQFIKGPCQQTQTSDDSSKGSSESDEPLKSPA